MRIAFVIIAVTVAVFIAASALNTYVIGVSIRLGSSVMEPTIHKGEWVRMVGLLGGPRRYQLIVFAIPGVSNQATIMRVIGLPNETIRLTTNGVLVDGSRLNPPKMMNYSHLRLNDPFGHIGFTNDFRIPADGFFVLGDNLTNALDSRFVGAIPRDKIYGIVKR